LNNHHAAGLRATLDENLAAFDRITAEKLRLVPAPFRGQFLTLRDAFRDWMVTASEELVAQRALLDRAGDALGGALDDLDALEGTNDG